MSLSLAKEYKSGLHLLLLFHPDLGKSVEVYDKCPRRVGTVSVSQTVLHFQAEWYEHRTPTWAVLRSSDGSRDRAIGRLGNMLKPGWPQQFLG